MQETGEAHQTGESADDRRELWAAGRARPGQESPDNKPRRAWAVPARKMGMLRYPLVAALFGHPVAALGN
jgi:hypothetical protein